MKFFNENVTLCRSNYSKFKNPKTKRCENVEKFTWTTENRLQVSLLSFGASLLEIKAPDRTGELEDVLMGFAGFEDHLRDRKFFFGSIAGPVCGIVENGEYCVSGKSRRLPRNYQRTHWTNKGFDDISKVNWKTFIDGTDVILSHVVEGSKGFPAVVLIQLYFSVRANNSLTIKATARSNQVTPFDICHQLYLNLAAHNSGSEELLQHLVTVDANEFCVLASDGIFKGSTQGIEMSECDLRTRKKFSDVHNGNFDCHYVTRNNKPDEVNFIARIIHPKSGRILEVYSNQATLRLTTCTEMPKSTIENLETEKVMQSDSLAHLTLDYLRTKLTDKEIEFFKCCPDDTDSIKLRDGTEDTAAPECPVLERLSPDQSNSDDEPIKGKDNSTYYRNSGFFISCQNFPNAVNHQETCPNILLRPGEVYENILQLNFLVHVTKK